MLYRYAHLCAILKTKHAFFGGKPRAFSRKKIMDQIEDINVFKICLRGWG